MDERNVVRRKEGRCNSAGDEEGKEEYYNVRIVTCLWISAFNSINRSDEGKKSKKRFNNEE